MKEQQHNIHDTTIWVEDTIIIHDETRARLQAGPVNKNNSTIRGSGTMAPPTTPTTSMNPRRILSSPLIDDASSEVDNLRTPSKESSSSSPPGTDSENYHPRGGVLLPETAAATKKLTSNNLLPNETSPHHPRARASCSKGSNGTMRRILMATGSMDDVPRTPPDMAHATMPLHTTTTTTGVMWVPLGLPTVQSFLQANMGAALDLLAEDPKKENDDVEEESPCEEETVTMESSTTTTTSISTTTIQDLSVLLRLRNKRVSRRSTSSFPTTQQKEGSSDTIPTMPFLFD